jgi:hypothetical protein
VEKMDKFVKMNSKYINKVSSVILMVLFSFLVVSFQIGCGKKPPEWVIKGAGAFSPKEKKLYGVGVSELSPNEAMTRIRCDTRARADLARVLDSYVASLITDFMEEHKDYFNKDAEGSDEFTQIIIKSTTEALLVGSQIVDRYTDEKKKVMYCLALLEVDNVLQETFNKMKDMARQKHRAIVKERAEEMLQKLDEELKKRTERGY